MTESALSLRLPPSPRSRSSPIADAFCHPWPSPAPPARTQTPPHRTQYATPAKPEGRLPNQNASCFLHRRIGLAFLLSDREFAVLHNHPVFANNNMPWTI